MYSRRYVRGHHLPMTVFYGRCSGAVTNATLIQEQEKKNLALVTQAGANIFTDIEKFKKIVESAISHYLQEIENKWFFGAEREQINNIKIKMNNAKSSAQIIVVLKEIVALANKELDLTILNYINVNFCANKLTGSIELKRLINEIDKHQTKRNKISLCFAAFKHNEKSNFHHLPLELVVDITMKLNKM